jgi:hypothetical protein
MPHVANEEVERINRNLIGTIHARMIEVTDDTYAAEQISMPDTNQKGFHLYRNKRKVSAALNLGHTKIHEDKESHAHRPRQRMEVVFSPSLDGVVGSTWNKTMRDGPLAQRVLDHALYRIFRQRGYAWALQSILDAQNSRARPFAMGGDTDSDASSTDTDQVPRHPAATRTFYDVIVPKTPEALPATPTSQLEDELEEETLEVDAPLPPVPSVLHVTVPVSEPSIAWLPKVIAYAKEVKGERLGDREVAIMLQAELEAYLTSQPWNV